MKFRLKLTGAAMLLGAIVSHGADVPAFRYSGTAAERAWLNNMSALMFGGNAIRCALSTRELPEGISCALLVEGSSPAGRRENILVAFPRSRVAGAELQYRALSGRGKLILGLGSGENYRQREVTLDPGDGGWKEVSYADERIRDLTCVTIAFVTEGEPLLFEVAGLKVRTPEENVIDAIAPERHFLAFDSAAVPAPEGKSPSMNGRVILGMGGGYAAIPASIDAIEKIAGIFGNDRFAIAPDFDYGQIAPLRNDYLRRDLPMSYQTTLVREVGGFFGAHGAFGEGLSGFSRNRELDRRKWPGGAQYHGGSFCHPAAAEAHKKIIDKLAAAGIADYIMPDVGWWESSTAGFSKADETAFRACLAGNDPGVEFALFPEGRRRIRFPEYFKWTFGVELTPQKLGLDSYDGFAAPRSRAPGGESPQYRLRLAVFYALKRYALLRFFDEIGAYGKSKGVNVVAMPLNCSCFGQGMARLDGLLAVNFDLCDVNSFNSPESPAYGRPGELPAEAGLFGMIARGMSRSEAAKASGTKLRLIHETGQAGAAIPYRDPRLNYVLNYALTGATGADSMQIDFLSTYTHRGLPTWALLNDPEQRFHHSRLVDQLVVAAAFRDAFDAGLKAPDNRGEVISIVRSADYFAVREEAGIGDVAWRKLLYPVEFLDRAMLDAPFVAEKTRVIFADGKGHTDREVQSLTAYLKRGGNRTLVLSPLSAGRRFDGSDLLSAYYGEDTELNDGEAYAGFGISAAGKNGAYSFRLDGFKTVAQENGRPLLSVKTLANGASLYLFHREATDADRALIAGILEKAQVMPFGKGDADLLVQEFDLPSGGKVFALFDRRPWNGFVFRSGAPSRENFMRYETGLPPATVTVSGGRGILYELISGEKRPFDGGELTLDTAGKSARLYFLLPETPQGKAELTGAEARHAFLNRYVTEELAGFLNDNQE